jgi:hypothetical protein
MYLLSLSGFNETLTYSKIFLKNAQMSNFMKICPVGAELFWVDKQTGRHDEASSPFSQFCKRA